MQKKLSKKVNSYKLIVRTIAGLFYYVPFIIFLFLSPNIESNVLRLSLLGILCFFLIIVMLVNFVLPLYIYRMYGYEVYGDHYIIKKGILVQRRDLIPLRRIQHVELSRNPFELLMDLGTVIVYTAGSVETISGLNLEDANLLIQDIKTKLDSYLEGMNDNE